MEYKRIGAFLGDIDFNANILPGCGDDGSKSLENSVLQLKNAKKAYVQSICATPHFYAYKEHMDQFFKRREQSLEMLRRVMPDKAMNLLLGAEVRAFSDLDKVDGLEKLCIEGSDYLLVEVPSFKCSETVLETLREINNRGTVRIVLSHINRFDKSEAESLLDEGFLGQVDAEAFNGLFFKNKHLTEWIKSGKIIGIASNVSGTDNDYREWLKAKKRLYSVWKILMNRPEIVYY